MRLTDSGKRALKGDKPTGGATGWALNTAMPPVVPQKSKHQHKAFGDSASSPGPFTLNRAGSTCDSSNCAFCQPQQKLPQELRPGGSSPHSTADWRKLDSLSDAACQLSTLERAESQADGSGATLKGTGSQESSPASSQTVQHMIGASTFRSDELENASGKEGADDESSEDWPERPQSLDDFVTIERSELRRSYASATSLAQEGDANAQKRQKRASSDSEEFSRDDTPSWVWNMEWELQPDPVPAQFQEIACFERPTASQHKRHNADIVCGIEFSPDGRFLASAGVTKQIRVYPLGEVKDGEEDARPVRAAFIHRVPSKISSIAWDPFNEGMVTVGDYDGVVAQVHIPSGHLLADVDEYMGRRVWSVAHSQHRPNLCASSSDDGTAHLWAGRGLSQRAGQISIPGSVPISCASFCPEDENVLALAASDCCAYVYDIRNLTEPLQVLKGHDRPLSFARFMGRNRLVTASVDSSLALWNLDQGAGRLFRRYEGHMNQKNFVGLSVCPETELMATGSECGQAVAYHRAWSRPVAAHDVCCKAGSSASTQEDGLKLQGLSQTGEAVRKAIAAPNQALAAGLGGAQQMPELASAVCWWPTSLGAFAGRCGGPVLAAARSDGVLSLLTLVNAQ